MLDEREFLSPHGIRSLSAVHAREPYCLEVDHSSYEVHYAPGESDTGLFGGNSNWRGPVWFPVNYLIIEALKRYHHFYGDQLTVECPTGSGIRMHLGEVAEELERRLVSLVLPDAHGRRPCHGGAERYADRSGVSRPRAVLRVLPRRHRPRPRRQPPDRVDRARGQPDRAGRRRAEHPMRGR